MRDWLANKLFGKTLARAKALVANAQAQHELNLRFFAALRMRAAVLNAREAELNQRAELLAESAAQMNAAVVALRDSLVDAPSDKPTLQ